MADDLRRDLLSGVEASRQELVNIVRTIESDILLVESLPPLTREAARVGVSQYMSSLGEFRPFPLREKAETTIAACRFDATPVAPDFRFMVFRLTDSYEFVFPGMLEQPSSYLPLLLVGSGELLSEASTYSKLAQPRIALFVPVPRNWASEVRDEDWAWAREFAFLRNVGATATKATDLEVQLRLRDSTPLQQGEVRYRKVTSSRALTRLGEAGLPVSGLRRELEDALSRQLLQVYEPIYVATGKGRSVHRQTVEPGMRMTCRTIWDYWLPVEGPTAARAADASSRLPRVEVFQGVLNAPQTTSEVAFSIEDEALQRIRMLPELMNVPYPGLFTGIEGQGRGRREGGGAPPG